METYTNSLYRDSTQSILPSLVKNHLEHCVEKTGEDYISIGFATLSAKFPRVVS